MVCKGLGLYANSKRTGVDAIGKQFGDVIAHSISVELMGEDGLYDHEIIKKNSDIPCVSDEIILTTTYDLQPSLPFIIKQDGKVLMEFVMDKLPLMIAGQISVQLIVRVENDGQLHVSGKLLSNVGRKIEREMVSDEKPQISNVNDEEIERMRQLIEEIFNLGKH